MVFIGADHRGFQLKEVIKKWLFDEGFIITDLGNDHYDPNDDYVDFAKKVAEATKNVSTNRGILLCGSGAGVDIVANKIDGIRSALVSDEKRAIQAREDEDANVISLPADLLEQEQAFDIIKSFLTTNFSGEKRHQRRIAKIKLIEKMN